MGNFITDARLVKLNVLAGSGQKNIFHSRITILLALGALALGALVAAPPNNPQQPPNSWAAASPHSPLANAKWRYRRSVADPTTLSSEALELLTKRHFYEQQKTRYPCYKTFYVGKLKYFTIASLYFCIRLSFAICHSLKRMARHCIRLGRMIGKCGALPFR